MTTAEATLNRPQKPGLVAGLFNDAFAVAQRYLIAYKRVPQLLVFSTIQPVIFVLMWRYVFGGAIREAGTGKYVDFLMPGIFIQTVVFGAMGASIGLATDMKTGLLERFRSLPMARSAVLAGRTFADLVRNVFVVVLMALIGFAVGFRFHAGIGAFLLGLLLVLLFGYVMSWVFATVGLIVGDPESAQAAAFPVLAVFVFASSIFVSPKYMPGWLQVFAEHQPVSMTASAVRALSIGGPTAKYVTWTLIYMALITVLAAPLAVSRYRKAV